MIDILFHIPRLLPRTGFCVLVSFFAALILTCYRIWLYYENAAELSGLTLRDRLRLFGVGFRLDAVIISRTFIAFALILLVLPERAVPICNTIFLVCTGIVFLIIFFAETAGIYFFRYYDFRPNYLVFEYGADPEVLRTIVKAYPVFRIIILSGLGTMVTLFMLSRAVSLPASIDGTALPWLWDRAGVFICLVMTGIATRGSLSHRALNPSYAVFTRNRIANEIAGCGIFNVLYGWGHQFKNEFTDLKTVIKHIPREEAMRRSQTVLSVQGRLAADGPNPLVRVIETDTPAQPLNVVLVVMESFTNRLVGALGGNPALTPELDKLASKGILMEQCYATGERTIQGLEAAVSSFPPLPGAGVVKRPQARQSFATLASVLKEREYETLFLYGGQGTFDHMRGFFLNNGFDTFIEERDFKNPVFRGAWGVSDEDLFRRADKEFRSITDQGRNFFATILTVSLHSPWEYPPGRIQPLPAGTKVPHGFELEELNNFLYADYAVGQFIREARSASYFDNTLFVFVGDHGVHLRGRDLIPADDYLVPALFFAPEHLKPQRLSSVISQIDLPPTIMGILGGTYRSTFFGRDVLGRNSRDNFAIIIYNKKRYGIVSGSHLVALTETGETIAYERGNGSAAWQPVTLSPQHQEISHNAQALLSAAEGLLISGRYNTASHAEKTQQGS